MLAFEEKLNRPHRSLAIFVWTEFLLRCSITGIWLPTGLGDLLQRTGQLFTQLLDGEAIGARHFFHVKVQPSLLAVLLQVIGVEQDGTACGQVVKKDAGVVGYQYVGDGQQLRSIDGLRCDTDVLQASVCQGLF